MKNKTNTKINFIRSLLLILLSVILLISAVVAWFKIDAKVTARGLTVSVDNTSISVTDENGNQLTTEDPIAIPCATKIDDSTVSSADLSKTLLIKELHVYYSGENNDVIVTCKTISSNLHYYFDTEYSSSDTASSYANLLKNDSSARDTVNNNGLIDRNSQSYTDSKGKYYKVAIVFYSDYIDGEKTHSYGAEFNFAV